MPNVGAEAVALRDGRVLVMGSSNDGGDAVTGLWDPATGTWQPTEGLNKPRDGFLLLPLHDGRALVIGGRNESDQSYSSSYIFDPLTYGWSKSGLLGTARTIPSGALLPDGRVLVAGGYYAVKPNFGQDDAPGAVLAAYEPSTGRSFAPRLADMDPAMIGRAMATAELFDPASDTWSNTGSLAYARAGAPAVALADGRVLVVGSVSWDQGVATDGRAGETAEIYDPATERFSLVGSLPDIEPLDIKKDWWPRSGDGASSCGGGTLVALDDGGALLIGHEDDWKHVGWVTRSFRFDPVSEQWSEIGQTYAAFNDGETGQTSKTTGVRDLSGAMVARLPRGRVLIAGGAGTEGWDKTDAAQLYDPTTDTWSELPPMPEARRYGTVVALGDGSVLLLGGYGDLPEERTNAPAVRFVPAR